VIDGHRFEIGATLLSGFGPGGPLSGLCQRLGISLSSKECDPAFQVALPRHRISLWAGPEACWREIRREFPNDFSGWQTLWSELEALATERERALQGLPPLPPEGWVQRLRVWRVLRRGSASSGPAGAGSPAGAGGKLRPALATSLRATMVRHRLGESSQRVLEASLWYLLLRSPDECSTLEAAVALQQVRRGTVAITGGMPVLVDALVTKFQQDGGQLRLETPVARCLWERGRITGLVTEGGETIRARVVVANVPPAVLTGSLLPSSRWRLRCRPDLQGPWHPTHVAQVLAVAVPETLVPSELSGHCFVVRDPHRLARDENVIFIRTTPDWGEGQGPGGFRCLTACRFVPPRPGGEDESASDLLEALDRIVPGVGSGMILRRVLSPLALGEAWGRPSAGVRYAADSPEWLGRRGLPHRLGWPGLLAVGEWTYPGRLANNVVEGAMRVVDLITERA
jgi:phytoene dehydrogenase-like protein